jgi:hypothetical protein
MIITLKVLLIIQILLLLFLVVSWLYYTISIAFLYWNDFPTIKAAWEAYRKEGKEKGYKMKKWDVWMEGYSATGEHARAELCGRFKGKTFADACKEWAKTLAQPEFFNFGELTYWGRRLFKTEHAARKFCG